MGIAGANLRVRRRAKVFKDEIESETKERHLTCPPDVFQQIGNDQFAWCTVFVGSPYARASGTY